MTDDPPREVLARRLTGAGVLEDRLISVNDGQKKSPIAHSDPANRYSTFAPLSGNYGVYAGPNPERTTWLIDVDIDDYGADVDDDALQAVLDLPDTLTVKTPHTDGETGGHRFYVVDDADLPERIRSFLGRDVVNPGPSWGEIRVENQYVVGPGSQLDGCDKEWCETCELDDGGRYTIAVDAPIAEVDVDDLLEVLRADGYGGSSAQTEISGANGGVQGDSPDANPGVDAGGGTSSPADDYDPAGTDLTTAVTTESTLAKYLAAGAAAAGFTADGGGGDRSRADYFACCTAIEYGVPEADIREELAECPHSKVDAADAARDYWPRTWRRALDEDGLTPNCKAPTPTPTPTTDGGAAAVDAAGGGDDLEAADAWERARQQIVAEVRVPYDRSDDDEGATIDKRTAVDRTANIYHREFSWVRPRSDTRGWRATLYNYVPDEGIYEPHGEAEIERMIDAHLGPVADNHFLNEVVGKVERKARVRAKRLDESAERLVVANGILDLTTGELDDHTPAEFHRSRLGVEYDPDAETDAVDDFMHDIVRERDADRLYRFIAHTLYRGYPEAKAAMLLGEGENGKTTFLNLVEAFLGDFNVSHQPLKKINEHEWSPARLNGQLANIDGDMSDQSRDSMGMFKRLTGGDPIDGEVKFEQAVRFTNHATMLFACNEMPVLNDDTRGNWRRWQLIKFPYVFSEPGEDGKDKIDEEELKSRLFTDAEFSGLLNRCVEEIAAWDDGRAFFPDADSWETTRDKMRRAAEPVYDFAHTCLRAVDDGEATLPKDTVREAYRRYATQQGLKKLTDEVFGRRLLGLSDFNIEAGRIRDENRRLRVYKGVELTSRGEQILQDGADHEDAQQAALDTTVPDDASGQRADLNRVGETLRDAGGELSRGEFLATFCQRYDADPETAEAIVDKARRHGVIEAPADEVVTLIE